MRYYPEKGEVVRVKIVSERWRRSFLRRLGTDSFLWQRTGKPFMARSGAVLCKGRAYVPGLGMVDKVYVPWSTSVARFERVTDWEQVEKILNEEVE